jgi:primase-polymerase (primpol)-like protein
MPRPFNFREFDPTRIPGNLRDTPRWICWRHVQRDENEPAKVPTDPTGGFNIDPLDAAHWMSFDAAVAVCRADQTVAGLGFVFDGSDDYSGVDLDDCFDAHGYLCAEAQAIVQRFSTYTEVSPSGTGVKMFLQGRKPEGLTNCTSRAIEGISKIEVYDHDRFFAVTGMALDGTTGTLEAREPQLHELCLQLWPPKQAHVSTPVNGGFDGDDQALIDKAMTAANGARP